MAIFLLSLVALGRLVIMGSDMALEVRYESEAAQICQTKLAEVMAGAIPLQSQSATNVEEDPDWQWALEAQQGSVSGLWSIQVIVSRQFPDGSTREYCSVSQMVLEPSLRGSTQ